MDYIAQLELEAASKYSETEHSYGYATCNESLQVPGRPAPEVIDKVQSTDNRP